MAHSKCYKSILNFHYQNKPTNLKYPCFYLAT